MFFKLQAIIALYCSSLIITKGNTEEITTTDPLIEDVFINDENNHTWTSDNFPQPYPENNKTIKVKVGKGYSISVIITQLDLDSESGDYLIIKAGTALNDQNTGKIFTHNLKKPRQYIVDSENVIMSFRVTGRNEPGKKGFSLVYKREGVVVSTEVPVTEITWPTPSETDHIYFTGNVSGRNQNEFENQTVLDDFKNAVAEMATQYCATQNISYKDNITELNVHVKNLISCPYEWPKSNTCVKIRFSVPIFLSEETNTSRYELSAQNLEQMWYKFGNEFLKKVSMSLYEEPNADSNLLLWLIISCLVLVIFIIVVLVARTASSHLSPLKTMKRRNSDTQGIVKNEMRASNLSLSPHPLQVIPPFFDIDSSFSRYEPDIRESPKQYDYLSDDESDNEITIGRFSNSRNNTPDHKTESVT